jgi:TPR repeat protein
VFAFILFSVAAAWIVYNWTPRKAGGPQPAQDERVQAKFKQAEQYYYGRGRAQDFTMAAALYRECAEQGFAPAMNSLGRLQELGQGVPRDLAQAKAWYEKAAALGNPDAQAALSTLTSWTVLIATDGSIDYPKRWVANAAQGGLGPVSVYVRDGKYLTTIGQFVTRAQAEKAAVSLRPKTRPDAVAIDLTNLCPSSTKQNEGGLQVSVCRTP